MPPVPTFPTVKLRPDLVSGMVSIGFVFLEDRAERCLKTSVLFFTRLNEPALFFPPTVGAEMFLTCRCDTSVTGVLAVFLGLEPCCEVSGTVVVRVVPVMWLATAGSSEISDVRVLTVDSETMAVTNQGRNIEGMPLQPWSWAGQCARLLHGISATDME